MQSNTLLAFRKRAKKRGYKSIKIKRCREVAENGEALYTVTAVEPLTFTEVSRTYLESTFSFLMR